MRFRACCSKLNENYITAGCENAPNVKLVKPIFDWSEDDVFKYLYENKIEYARIYDEQVMAGVRFRVSTPLHPEAAKRFDKLRAVDPVFYAQVVDVFPEMLTHERYYKDIDFSTAFAKYGQTLDGVKQWIIENYSDNPPILKKALLRFNRVLPRAKRIPDRYSPGYLLKFFMAGTFKREILPNVKKRK